MHNELKGYTVTLTWLVWKNSEYRQKSRTVKVKAYDILHASNLDMHAVGDRICLQVSQVWVDWPSKV